MKEGKHTTIRLIFVLAFFCMLIVPAVFTVVDFNKNSSCENRTLAVFPKWELSHRFLVKFNAFFDDHYGFRKQFTQTQAQIKLKLFQSSNNPKDCIIGKNGWYYYNSELDLAYGSYSHTNLLNEAELKAYEKLHTDRKKLLQEKGIDYLLLVCPDKSTIYPEYMPFQMRIQIRENESKTDQLLRYLKRTKSALDLTDVRSLLKSKKAKTLYLKHDSHWNALGAFYAYESFLNKHQEIFGTNAFSLSDFYVTSETKKGGDLLNMLGLCDQSDISEIVPVLKLKQPINVLLDDEPLKDSYGRRNPNSKNPKRVLFFRDSYGSALIPYFSLHFKESYFVWSDYDQKVVDLLKPDVVVVERVERYL